MISLVLLLACAPRHPAPGAELADFQSLPLYLDADRINAVFAQARDRLAACSEAASGALKDAVATLVLDIGTDGVPAQVHVAAPGTGQATVDACLVQNAGSLRFPKHYEDPVRVNYPVVVRRGRLYPGPVGHLASRTVEPLFLFVPENLSADQRALLRRALGAPVLPNRPP